MPVNGCTLFRMSVITPTGTPSRNIGTPTSVRNAPVPRDACVIRVGFDIADLNNNFALEQRTSRSTGAAKFYRILLLDKLTEIVRQTKRRRPIEHVVLAPRNDPHIGFTQSPG